MDPAPKKPTPLTTWEAIREMSVSPGKWISIYWAVIITIAAPKQTDASVRAPPPLRFTPRSIPIKAPKIKEDSIRITIFCKFHWVNDVKNIKYATALIQPIEMNTFHIKVVMLHIEIMIQKV